MPRGRPFKAGQPRPPGSGRKPGTPNKITRDMEQLYLATFDRIGGEDAFANWARQNLAEFYRLHHALLPKRSEAKVEVTEKSLDDLIREAHQAAQGSPTPPSGGTDDVDNTGDKGEAGAEGS